MVRHDSENVYDGVEEVPGRRVNHDVDEKEAEEEYVRQRKRQRAAKRAIGVGGSGEGETEGSDRGRRRKPPVMKFIDFEAEVDDDEEEEDEGEDDADFIDEGAELVMVNKPEQRMGRVDIIAEECEDDINEMERRVMERYTGHSRRIMERQERDHAGDANEVEQQALLPTLSDPKLWLVKCAV